MHKKKKLQRESIAERNAENGGREAADFLQERLVILLYHLFFKIASAAERDMAESALRGAMRRAIPGGSEEQCSNRGCYPCVGRKQR